MHLTVFSKSNCTFCDQAKALLTSKNIPYTEIRVDQDPEAMAFLKAQGHRAVPQIYKNGELFVQGGFAGLKQLSDEQLNACKE